MLASSRLIRCQFRKKVKVRFISSAVNQKVAVKWLGIGAVAMIAAENVRMYFVSSKELVKDLQSVAESFQKSMVFAIDNRKEYHKLSISEVVERPELEAKIANALDMKGQGVYTVVYGTKGTGKTEVVDQCADGRKGVIRVNVASVEDEEGLIDMFVSELMGTHESKIKIDQLLKAVYKCNQIPTIVFDVAEGGSSVIKAVRTLAKALSVRCAVVIVLSNPDAILNFGMDSDRENLIFVDELQPLEAKLVLKTLKCNLSEEAENFVLQTIGTRPARLKKMLNEVPFTCSWKEFVMKELRMAKADISAFRHKAILEALAKSPDGVPVDQFSDMKSGEVHLSNPVEVMQGMKKVNTILYHHASYEYRLQSTAHRTMLLHPTLLQDESNFDVLMTKKVSP